jgi:hypothetical protein
MDCDAARRLIEDGRETVALQSHLEQCVGCRQEAEFVERVAAAVGALPRVPAPKGFDEAVMAALSTREIVARAPRRALPLLLRPWELGWIALGCLGLACAVLRIIGAWLGAGGIGEAGAALLGWDGGLRGSVSPTSGRSLAGAWLELGRGWQVIAERAGDWNGPWAMALCGTVVFAVALCFLLSHSPSGAPGPQTEDAHV